MEFVKSFLSCLVLTGALFCQTAIDTTLTKALSTGSDDLHAYVKLHLEAPSFEHPFLATLQILLNDQVVYTYVDSTSIAEYVFEMQAGEGADYRSIKKEFYYERFMGLSVTNEIRFGGGPEYLLNENYGGSIHKIAFKELTKKSQLSGPEARQVIERLIGEIKSGEAWITMHRIGLYSSPPMMYVEEVDKLIPIYSP